MMLRMMIVVLLLVSSVAEAQPPAFPISACGDSYPYGLPSIAKKTTNSQYVCRTAYMVVHDNRAKIPALVSYVLTPNHTTGCIKRSGGFQADYSLPANGRAVPQDYEFSGWDQGHMAPDSDMSWNAVVEDESFILSNVAPQDPSLNRGKWKKLESHVRVWAFERNHELLVYVGPVYDYTLPTIPNTGVVIPSAFFKVVVDIETAEVMSFVYENKAYHDKDLNNQLVTVEAVEQLIGFDLPMPSTFVNVSKVWSGRPKSVADAKKVSCSIQ